ncbi:hypothetical protein BKG80_18950 [Mycobacteroides chelonae]|uniref:hypothetical protein n=1 Tax=Mycobacteroides chelonae TaxID=1774 RepID=UPI0008AA4999|nr:hypothetical protein [Mycobacteroides chelonae]MBF9349270.1 hypothetical protein [Mycobacteroides chelonae]OHU34967.1 hypothetical protein BKG80_18950 [Mycobacteroides chelonae]
MTDLHIVFTESGDDYGWTIESPQVPELIGGRSTSEELLADAPDIIDWATDRQVFDHIFAHEQHIVADPQGRQYLIRWQFTDDDHNSDARYETAGRLNFAVTSGLITPEEFGQHPALELTGERLYIAVVGTDTLGWIQDQLSDRENCCILAEHLGDGAVANLPFAPTGTLKTGIDVEKLGLTRDSTFDEMRDAVLAHEIESLKKTYIPQDTEIPRHITGFTGALS